MKATCGHEVKDGIMCEIDDGQILSSGEPAITYGSYCHKCLFHYFISGDIESKEMNAFIALIIGWSEGSEVNE